MERYFQAPSILCIWNQLAQQMRESNYYGMYSGAIARENLPANHFFNVRKDAILCKSFLTNRIVFGNLL